mgnify:CR=1 FL=1
MHPSLLPKYRGACPIQHAILNGESETGVSIIQISKGVFDAGPIVWQRSIPLSPVDTFKHAQFELSKLGGIGLFEVLSD